MHRVILMAAAVAAAVGVSGAHAHGFAGKRFLPATVAIEDPFVADELSLPTVSTFKEPAEGEEPATREVEIEAEFAKRITPEFGIFVEGGHAWRIPDEGDARHGWHNAEVGAKYQFLADDRRELVLSVGLGVKLGGTGDERVEADPFSTFTPAIFFGKGLGDLAEGAALLRPLALTGFVGLTVPERSSTTHAHGGEDGELQLETERHPHVLRYGLAIQYSIPYLQAFVRDVGLGPPFDRLIPIVELVLETPLDRGHGGKTTGTVNPGLLWSGHRVQMGIEAVIPVNARSGSGTGVIGQLHFYLDDLLPGPLSQPIWSGGP